MFQQTTIRTSEDNNHRRGKSVFDEMDPFSSTSFGEVPPSACSTFSEDPTAARTDDQRPTTADEAGDGTWTSSSLFDAAATTTTAVTVDSQDMAFVLTESSDALSSAATPSVAADTASPGPSMRCDDNESAEKTNGEEPVAAADTYQHINDDDDDEVRKTRMIFSFFVPFQSVYFFCVHRRNLLHGLSATLPVNLGMHFVGHWNVTSSVS